MKKYLYLVLVNVLIFITLLLSIEIIVRISFPQIQIPGTDHALFKDSIYYNTAGLQPNANGSCYGIPLQVDNNGFWKYSKKSKTANRVLYVGDSVTMGIGVESDSSFSGIINNEENVQILNSAMIGYSGSDYLNIIRKIFVEDNNTLDISKVSLYWCLNDVYDDYPYNTTPEFRPEGIFGQVLTFFKANFKLFYFLKDSFTDRPKSYYLYDEKFYKPGNELFMKSLKSLIDISEILKSKSISFEIFLLPYEYQLRAEEKLEVNPQQLLADSLSSYGIAVFNLTEKFKELPEPEELYLYGDGIHFSNKGHRLTAEYIKSFNVH